MNTLRLQQAWPSLLLFGFLGILGAYLLLSSPLRFPVAEVFVRSVTFEFLALLFGIPALLIQLRNSRALHSPLAIAFYVWLCVLLLSTLFSINPALSFWGRIDRLNGTFRIFELSGIFFLARLILYSDLWQTAFLRMTVFLGIAEACIAVKQAFFPSAVVALFGMRPFGTLPNPNSLALLIVLFFFLHLLLLTSQKERFNWRVAATVVCALDIVTLILIHSRGALVGLLLGCTLVVFLLRGKISGAASGKKIIAVFFLFVVIAFGTFIAFTTQNFFLAHIVDPATGQSRLLAWQSSLHAFSNMPILGWGPATFPIAFSAHYPSGFSGHLGNVSWFDFAHNEFLNSAVEQGSLGVAALMMLFVVSFWILFTLKKKGALSPETAAILSGLLVAYGASLFFLFHDQHTWVMFFIVFGLCDALWLRSYRQPALSAIYSRTSSVLAGGALLIALGAATAAIPIYAAALKSTGLELLVNQKDQSMLFNTFLELKAAQEAKPFSAWLPIAKALLFFEGAIKDENALFAPENGGTVIATMMKGVVEEEIKRFPEFSRLWLARGRSEEFLAFGKPTTTLLLQDAEKHLERGHMLAPNREEIRWALGETEMALEKWDEAETRYRDVTAFNPALGEGHGRLALFYLGYAASDALQRSQANFYLQRAKEEFIAARKYGFALNGFFKPLWFADPFAWKGDWGKSAEFWENALTMCKEISGEEKNECSVFSSHARTAEQLRSAPSR